MERNEAAESRKGGDNRGVFERFVEVVQDRVTRAPFFLVCLVNTVGLMLAKFLRRAGELGVRRALGASRRHIFAQLLVEAGIVGVAGGIVGLGLAWVGLTLVRLNPNRSAQLAHMDLSMLATTFVLSVVAASLAGLLPAWRACQVPPGLHLKSQ